MSATELNMYELPLARVPSPRPTSYQRTYTLSLKIQTFSFKNEKGITLN